MIKQRICALMILFLMMPTIANASSISMPQIGEHVNQAESNVSEQIVFKMPLSQDITKTQFTQTVYAEYKTNDSARQYQMKGIPFLYKNTTYVPVRDIAEAFGIQVTYNSYISRK